MEKNLVDGRLPGVDGTGGKPVTTERERKPRVRAIDRKQMILYPTDIDGLIPHDHDARAIWQFVGSLDLSAFYRDIQAVEGQAGSPAHDPHVLMSIWIYAYSKGVSSAREIERLCASDPAYQWLSGMKPVNHHTLSDFRTGYGYALRERFIEVLGILSSEGLVTLERVMHDGTKVRACAGADTLRRRKTIQAYLDEARKQVRAMERAAEQEVSPRIQAARERSAREREQRLSHALEELKKIEATKRGGQERVSTTDPECRVMAQSDGGYAPSYNVQISTDGEEKAIVAVTVSQSASDQGQLPAALDEIEKTTGHVPGQVVVDGGFTNRETIIAVDGRVDLIGSLADASAVRTSILTYRGVEPEFYPERFSFDPAADTYTCPKGRLLTYRTKSTRRGKTSFLYRARSEDCADCPFKSACCPKARKGRAIVRAENDPRVTAFIQKMATDEARAVYKKRGEVAEFPNAWLKAKLGLRQFRLRGLVKVGIEALWACLTYNIKLWLRLSPRAGLRAA